MPAAIFKNSPIVRENGPSGQKKKKGPPPSYFSKRQDDKHVYFFIWPKKYIKIGSRFLNLSEGVNAPYVTTISGTDDNNRY